MMKLISWLHLVTCFVFSFLLGFIWHPVWYLYPEPRNIAAFFVILVIIIVSMYLGLKEAPKEETPQPTPVRYMYIDQDGEILLVDTSKHVDKVTGIVVATNDENFAGVGDVRDVK